jgi:RecA/RadA recombinase
MAKKKAVSDETKEENLDNPLKEDIRIRIAKEIEKDLGKNIMISGDDIIERPRMIIPFSPAIDSILGGGVPEGSWMLLTGKPKAGKSVSALHFAKNCQKEKYGNRNVYYLNVEGRLKKRDLEGIKDLNFGQLRIIESTEDKILTSQDYLTIAEKILMTDTKCVLILDSISALCDEREMTGGIGTQTRGGGARLLAQFCSQMGNVVPVKGSIVICILHIMANTSGYGLSTTEKGGNAVQYQADIRLRIEKFDPWSLKEGASPIGQVVNWKAYCTALGPPGRTCESYIRYGIGIDEFYEMLIAATDVGLIDSGGAWLYCEFMKDHLDIIDVPEGYIWHDESCKELDLRANGKDAMYTLLARRPEVANILYERLKDY